MSARRMLTCVVVLASCGGSEESTQVWREPVMNGDTGLVTNVGGFESVGALYQNGVAGMTAYHVNKRGCTGTIIGRGSSSAAGQSTTDFCVLTAGHCMPGANEIVGFSYGTGGWRGSNYGFRTLTSTTANTYYNLNGADIGLLKFTGAGSIPANSARPADLRAGKTCVDGQPCLRNNKTFSLNGGANPYMASGFADGNDLYVVGYGHSSLPHLPAGYKTCAVDADCGAGKFCIRSTTLTPSYNVRYCVDKALICSVHTDCTAAGQKCITDSADTSKKYCTLFMPQSCTADAPDANNKTDCARKYPSECGIGAIGAAGCRCWNFCADSSGCAKRGLPSANYCYPHRLAGVWQENASAASGKINSPWARPCWQVVGTDVGSGSGSGSCDAEALATDPLSLNKGWSGILNYDSGSPWLARASYTDSNNIEVAGVLVGGSMTVCTAWDSTLVSSGVPSRGYRCTNSATTLASAPIEYSGINIASEAVDTSAGTANYNALLKLGTSNVGDALINICGSNYFTCRNDAPAGTTGNGPIAAWLATSTNNANSFKDHQSCNHGFKYTGSTITAAANRSGTANAAWSFGGTASRIEIPSSAAINTLTNKFSLQAYAYVPASEAGNGLSRAMVTKGSTTMQWALFISSLNFKFGATINGVYTTVESQTISTDTWYKITVIYDGTLASGQLQIHAAPCSGSTCTGGSSATTTVTGNLAATGSQPVRIGYNPYMYNNQWVGYMDDVRLYNCRIDPTSTVTQPTCL